MPVMDKNRIAHLERLFLERAGKCRLGHPNCTDVTHYAYSVSKRLQVVTGYDSGTMHIVNVSYKTIQYTAVFQTMDDDGIIRYLTDYDIQSEKCLKNWGEADRDEKHWNYKAEYDARHNFKDRLPIKGTFNGIAKDIYYDTQPLFVIESLGVDGMTSHSMAKVRLTSDSTILFIDINDIMSNQSKNARRKASKRGQISPALQFAIDTYIGKVVTEYRCQFHSNRPF